MSKVKKFFITTNKSRPISTEGQVVEWLKYDEKLRQATKKNDLVKVQSCLRKGADPIKVDPHNGLAVIHEAASAGRTEVIELFLGPNNLDINVRDSTGKTALHHAVIKGQTNATLLLIKNGSDVRQVDNTNVSAAHHACSGTIDCLIILLKNGAPVDLKDMHGRTPLALATSHGQASICKLLLEYGANVNATDIKNKTPLMAAAKHGNAELCQFLVNKGADDSIASSKGMTALDYAISKNNISVRKVLERARRESMHSRDDEEGVSLTPSTTTPVHELEVKERNPNDKRDGPAIAVSHDPHDVYEKISCSSESDLEYQNAKEEEDTSSFHRRTAAMSTDNTDYFRATSYESSYGSNEGPLFPETAAVSAAAAAPVAASVEIRRRPFFEEPQYSEIKKLDRSSLTPDVDHSAVNSTVATAVLENDVYQNEAENYKQSLFQHGENPDESPELLVDVEELKRENSRLLEEMAELRNTSMNAIKQKQQELLEVSMQLEGYGHVAVERDIVSKELETTKMILLERDKSRRDKPVEINDIFLTENSDKAAKRERDEIYETSNQKLKDQLSMLRMEIASVRRELEEKTFQCDSQPFKNMDLVSLKAGKLSTDDAVETLKIQIERQERQIAAQLDDYNRTLKAMDDKNKIDVKLLRREKEQLTGELNEARLQLKDKDKELSAAVAAYEAAVKELKERSTRCSELEDLMKTIKESHDGELKSLAAENKRLDSEVEALRLDRVARPSKPDAVRRLEADIFQSKPVIEDLAACDTAQNPRLDLEINGHLLGIGSDCDSEVERTWKEVEKVPSARIIKTSRSNSEVSELSRPEWDKPDDIDGADGDNDLLLELQRLRLDLELFRVTNEKLTDRNAELETEISLLKRAVSDQTAHMNGSLERNLLSPEELVQQLDAQSSRLRIELADVRNELECKTIELQNSKQQHASLEDYEKVAMERNLLKKEVENLRVMLQSKPHAASSDKGRELEELTNRLRMEIADVRGDLENKTLELHNRNAQPKFLMEKPEIVNMTHASVGEFDKLAAERDFLKKEIENMHPFKDTTHQLRIEVAHVRKELETKTLELQNLKQENENLQNRLTKEVPDSLQGDKLTRKENCVERDTESLQELQHLTSKLRNEIAELRSELELKTLELQTSRQNHEHSIVEKQTALELNTSPEKWERLQSGEELGKMRIEIAETREQLEGKTLELQHLKQENDHLKNRQVISQVDNIQAKDLKKLCLERDLLKKDVERMLGQDDALNKLRVEVADLRRDLEQKTQELDDLKLMQEPLVREKTVILNSSNIHEPSNEVIMERDGLKKEVERLREFEDVSIRLRIEIADVRKELESKAIQLPTALLENAALQETPPLMSTSRPGEDDFGKLSVERDQLKRELENVHRLLRSKDSQAENARKLQDVTEKLRAEIRSVRSELETQTIELKDFKQEHQNLQDRYSARVDISDYKKLAAEKDQFKQELDSARELLRHLEADGAKNMHAAIELERIKDANKLLVDRGMEMQEDNDKLNQIVTANQKRFGDLTAQIRELEKNLAETEAACRELEKAKLALIEPQRNVDDIVADIRQPVHVTPVHSTPTPDREESADMLIAEQEQLKARNVELEDELDKLKLEMDDLRKQAADSQLKQEKKQSDWSRDEHNHLAKLALLKLDLERCTEELRDAEDQRAGLEKENQELRKQVHELRALLADQDQELNTSEKDELENCRAAIMDKDHALEEMQKKLAEADRNLENLRKLAVEKDLMSREMANLQLRLDESEQTRDDGEKLMTKQMERLNVLLKDHGIVKEALDQTKRELLQLQSINDSKDRIMEENNAKLAKAERGLDDLGKLTVERDGLKHELDQLRIERDSLQVKVREFEAEKLNYGDLIAAKDQQIAKLSDQLRGLRQIDVERDNLLAEIDQLQTVLQEKDRSIEDLHEEQDILLQQIEKLKAENAKRARDFQFAESEFSNVESELNDKIASLDEELQRAKLQDVVPASLVLEKDEEIRQLKEDMASKIHENKADRSDEEQAALSAESDVLRSEIKTLRLELEDSERRKNEDKLQVEDLLEEIRNLKDDHDRLSDSLGTTKHELSQLQSSMANKDRIIEEKTRKLAEAELRMEGFGKLSVDRDVMRREMDHLKLILRERTENRDVQELSKVRDELSKKIVDLEEEKKRHEELRNDADTELTRLRSDNQELIRKLELAVADKKLHNGLLREEDELEKTSAANLTSQAPVDGDLLAEKERLERELKALRLSSRSDLEYSEKKLREETERLSDVIRQLHLENEELNLKLSKLTADVNRLESERNGKKEYVVNGFVLDEELLGQSELEEQVKILREANRSLSNDVANLEHQLSMMRLDSNVAGGPNSALDQEHFHRKLKQFTRTEAQHAVLLKQKEEKCRRHMKKLHQLIEENNHLHDDLDSLNEFMRIQNTSKSPEDLQLKIRSSNATLEQLVATLGELDKRQRQQKRVSACDLDSSLNSSMCGGLNLSRIDDDLDGNSAMSSSRFEGFDVPPEQHDDLTFDGMHTTQIPWQQLQPVLDECHMEITRLHHKNKEIERHYNEIIATYRTHLLAAIQGRLEPDLRDYLIRIIQLRPVTVVTTRRADAIDSIVPERRD